MVNIDLNRAVLVGVALLAACGEQGGAAPARTTAAVATENRMALNSLTENRMALNALTANALVTNELTLQAFLNEPLLSDAVTSTELAPSGEPVGELTREFLKYLYSCAMPPGASMDLVIGGTSYGTLDGSLGLAPQWGAAGGSCDVTCQRWVTACLMARTNLFGVTVPISLRGPHPALATTAAEVAAYPVREGSFYGNLFEDSFEMGACTGPGSTAPELSARLCSSYGACRFFVRGPCTESICQPAQCTGSDANGNPTDCQLCQNDADCSTYAEVITAYLATPLAECGNEICQPSENTATCTDCKPGWAKRLIDSRSPRSVVEPGGDIVVAGSFKGTAELGGVTLVGSSAGWDTYLVRYDSTGTVEWAQALGCTPQNTMREDQVVAIAENGDIVLAAGFHGVTCTIGATTLVSTGTGFTNEDIFMARFAADGTPLWARLIAPVTDFGLNDLRVAPDGHIVLSGWFETSIDFGAPLAGTPYGMFVSSFTADGDYAWSAAENAGGFYRFPGIAVDPLSNVLFTGDAGASGLFIDKFAPDGTPVWQQLVAGAGFGAPSLVAADGAGNVLLAGYYYPSASELQPADFGGGPLPTGLDTAYLAKLSSTGTYLWAQRLGRHWLAYNPTLLTVDTGGAPLLIGWSVNADLGGGTILGGTDLDPALAVAKFGPGGGHLWSRNISGSYYAIPNSFGVDAAGNVVLAADYLSSSAVINGVLLDSGSDPSTVCSGNSFVASFPDEAGLERCNGLDDDGDGMVDEGLYLDTPCDGPDASEWCSEGLLACAGDGESVRCTDMTGTAVETCNGVDDDCDGTVDQAFPQLGDPCDGADGDPCRAGVVVCAPGGAGTVCDDPTPATQATCACTPGGTIDCPDDDPCTTDVCNAILACVVHQPDPTCAPDAGPGADGGPGGEGDGGGCGCRTSGSGRSPGGAALLIAVVGLLLLVRRRAVLLARAHRRRHGACSSRWSW